jgi:dihydroxyacetone kinase
MKKIINDPKNVVAEMCEGMELAFPDMIRYNSKYRFIRRKELDLNKVAIISGGGSGHEPFQGGYVGKGMLDIAVCGDMFAAPAMPNVYNAIREAASKKGVLLLVLNYTGDRLCFSGAAEMATEDDGIEVEKVLITDDVAVPEISARRGVAGAVLVDKIVGAAAEEGLSLSEVKRIAEKTVNNLRSMGFALSSCILPEKGTPIFQIGV